MSRRDTPGGALENLKREAKRWLKALRANDAGARARLERVLADAPQAPTLRDVQHALAREHGFAGWSALKTQLASDARTSAGPSIAAYERKAANLLDAYRTGTPEAMERHWRDTWHRRSWETMRRYVQLDLGKQPEESGGDASITLDDARRWVARDHGFESWVALTAYVSGLPADKRLIAARPLRLFDADREDGPEEWTRDWDVAIELLESGRFTGLDASGQMTDDLLERIAGIDQVAELALSGSDALSDAGLRSVARLPRLRRLELSGTGITDHALEIMRETSALEQLGLGATSITDDGAARLRSCERLCRIDLGGTRTGDGAIKALAGMPRLTHLKSGIGVTDAALPFLHEYPAFKTWQDGVVALELLSPDVQPNLLLLRGTFTNAGMRHLSGLNGLFGLNIDDARLPVTAAGLAPLVELPNLGFLAFDATDDAMPYIAAMPRLRFLICQDTVAGDDGFAALGQSRTIEYIWGRRCHNLRGRGFRALASMPALRSLSVSCKNVDDAALAVLPDFPALRELMPMDVPDDGYRHVGRCDRLESLVLMYCRETGDAATNHILGLRRLSRYFASYTQITDRTPELLATLPSLEKIELCGCSGVTNVGIAALGRSPSLRDLRLSGMQHVSSGATAGFPARIRVRYRP